MLLVCSAGLGGVEHIHEISTEAPSCSQGASTLCNTLNAPHAWARLSFRLGVWPLSGTAAGGSWDSQGTELLASRQGLNRFVSRLSMENRRRDSQNSVDAPSSQHGFAI